VNPLDVFINCPFSDDYREHFRAIVFTVVRSGFAPRCARERDDAGEVRYDKICRIIKDCAFGIHEISKTEPDADSGLPRFNMPFELGLFLGATKFGTRSSRTKATLILDREPYRYQAFLSDIAGQDIHAHGGEIGRLIEEIATWLRDHGRQPNIPGGRAISAEFERFSAALPAICAARNIEPDELTFLDYWTLASEWIVAEVG
jgi:hypothetical protein